MNGYSLMALLRIWYALDRLICPTDRRLQFLDHELKTVRGNQALSDARRRDMAAGIQAMQSSVRQEVAA